MTCNLSKRRTLWGYMGLALGESLWCWRNCTKSRNSCSINGLGCGWRDSRLRAQMCPILEPNTNDQRMFLMSHLLRSLLAAIRHDWYSLLRSIQFLGVPVPSTLSVFESAKQFFTTCRSGTVTRVPLPYSHILKPLRNSCNNFFKCPIMYPF